MKALSFGGIDVEASRSLADLKRLDPMKIFYRTMDKKIYNDGHEIPVRLFFPDEITYHGIGVTGHKVMLFIHGGGWVTEHVDNYDRVCARMASDTDHIVVAVEYRLAPEYRFPTGLLDCYAVAKAMYTNQFVFDLDPDDITLIGDSAGGNLAAALSLMARDKGDFLPRRQILIYPAVNSDYSEESPYPSVMENGEDYLLTRGKLRDYQDLYASCEEDKKNPYFAPILAEDLSSQPDTLVITAQYDPLRDEGEAYAERLKEAGNRVVMHRIEDALHGFFALGIKSFYVQKSFEFINQFLEEA